MPYCGRHGRAWYPGPTGAGWIALTPAQVAETQAWAQRYGFVEAVRVVPCACDQCDAVVLTKGAA